MTLATYTIEEVSNVGEIEGVLQNITNYKDLMKIDLPDDKDKIVVLRRMLHLVYQKINVLEKEVEDLKRRIKNG